MIKTVLCDLLGIEHPIVQGGMAWVGTAELVAAVSEAGAFGILGGGNAPPDYVRAQVRETKRRTRKPFGVNIPLFSPYVDDIVDICIEEGVKAVATGAGSPGAIIPRLKEHGMVVMPVVGKLERPRPLPGSITEAVLGPDAARTAPKRSSSAKRRAEEMA